MAEVPERLRAGLSGRYDLQREIGRGGMAVVYLAQDQRYDRLVAIKVLNQDLAAAVGRARFLREIHIAARLNHPHILPLLDSGDTGAFLYYVMPWVEGESLKDRIAREKQLPVADAIAIAREVADGLEHAHAQGVVHRDVKPANILLSGRSAVVADFGIARAVRRSATDDTLTDVNLAIGTPPYMSPEQWSGTRELDARSDVYSLGCVVYEMLAGHPPFTGSTTEAIAARVAFDPVPPLRTVRPKVSAALERAIVTALEKVPADRFATARAFADALAAAPQEDAVRDTTTVARWWRRWLRDRRAWAATAVGAFALVWALRYGRLESLLGAGRPSEADTTRYVVLPFDRAAGVPVFPGEEMLRDALASWRGIRVVDQSLVTQWLPPGGIARLDARRARSLARDLDAGRYIRGSVSIVGDSIRLYGAVHDVNQRATLVRDGWVKLPTTLARADSAVALLAERLLFDVLTTALQDRGPAGTQSAPARQAFARGLAAIDRWDLEAADSAFAAASRYDEEFARAFLWLGQVRSWSTAPVATWRSPAERAAAGHHRLSPRDRVRSDALLALGRGDYARACSRWRELTVEDSLDFIAWYGLGNCLTVDEEVVRDSRSPSGWRFRSSYHEATLAYQHAYQLLPAAHVALSNDTYRSVQVLLKTSSNWMRRGHAGPPDSGRFEAYASWQHDTLAFVPYADAHATATTNVAVRRQRERYHDLALAWVTAYPGSADAMEAVAVSLDLLGDPAALDTMRRARALATTPAARVRMAAAEAWMRVKRSAPDRLPELREARDLADSIVRANPPPGASQPILLAGLAALSGRAGLAAAYMRQTSVRTDWTIPGPIATTAAPLLVFAALGGPIDSLRVLEQDLATAIERGVPEDQRNELRAVWLGRAASLAFPRHRFATLQQVQGLGDYLVDAQASFARGDVLAVRRMFGGLGERRRDVPPEDRTLDAVYPEAALLAESGDTAGAIAWLDPTLSAIAAIPLLHFKDPTRAATLIRAIILRAELAASTDDPTAAKWGAAADVLWQNADPAIRRGARFQR